MPNHVTNVIELKGDKKQISELLEQIKNDDFGLGTIDFEKIIPMPDNIYKGNLGKEEMKLYSKNNWYDFCVANWGTKWNAYGYEKDVDYSNDGELRFLTAWNAPHPVISKLSEMFPDIEIVHEWADEDIGMNCGRYEYHDGERCGEYFPETDNEAVEFAAKVIGLELEEPEVTQKPKCPLINQNGNIFNLMGLASKTLKENGMSEQAKEMCGRITSSGSYCEALGIIGEYVEITSMDECEDEAEDMGMEMN
jgi:hypothetical protein